MLFIGDFKPDFLAGLLLFEECGGDRFLGVNVRHKDAAFGVLGFGASVDADT